MPSEYFELESGMREFPTALNTVYLEGPQSVSDAANELDLALTRELLTIAHCLADNVGKIDLLYKLVSDGMRSLKYDAKRKFITEARKALGE